MTRKSFSPTEYVEELKRGIALFQEKVKERSPDAVVTASNDKQAYAFLITVEHNHKEEHYQIAWNPLNGEVETTSVYGL